MSEPRARSPESPEPAGRTAAEWTTLGICLAILAALFAAITWLWIDSDSRPPTVEATPMLASVRQEGDAWYLPIEVTNRGDATAADVVIEAKLVTGQGEPETAELTFTFLASGETERGTAVLSSDPAAGELTIRPVSYTEP